MRIHITKWTNEALELLSLGVRVVGVAPAWPPKSNLANLAIYVVFIQKQRFVT